jgi:tetratricopeptide (TPR) repeat protein
MEEFRREPNYLPCQFELANLELQSTAVGADVNDELLARISKLADNEALEHSGSYLLARALKRRFVIRYRDMSVKNSDLVRLLVRQQVAIRATIRRKPTFSPAYVLLAQTYLTEDKSGVDSRSRDLLAPNYSQAINILRAVPNPDDEVLKLLAQCYGARNEPGDSEKEREHLENLVSSKPTKENFSELLDLYFQKQDTRKAIFLDEKAPAADGEIAKNIPAEKFEQLLSMRKSFETLDEYQGFRHQYLAMQSERDEIFSSGASTKLRHHKQMLEEYTEALRQFDSRNLPVPFQVLNNLAWYLVEDADAAQHARGLELADRARKAAVAGSKDDFDAKDTYAWALYKNGKHSEAEKAFRELTKASDNPLYRYHMARVLYDMQKFDDALSELRLALDASKPFGEAAAARELESEIREARRKAIGE